MKLAKDKKLIEKREAGGKDSRSRDKRAIQKKRRSPKMVIRDTFAELKKVTWPTKQDLLKYTLAVVVFVLAFAAATGGVDYVLTQAISLTSKIF
jgi:preprotein translocase subunit SecE